MRVSKFNTLLLGFTLLAIFAPKTEAKDFKEFFRGFSGKGLIDTLKNKLTRLWENKNIAFLDYVCSYNVRPALRVFAFYYHGTFWCPGWTHIIGEAETDSTTKVVIYAVKDFAQKALNKGLITEEEAKPWLIQ